MVAMDAHLHEQRRKEMAAFLAQQRTGVLCASASDVQGIWAMPVWYRPACTLPDGHELEVDCLVPRWADMAASLRQQMQVVFIVQAACGRGQRWLQIQGRARTIAAPDWARLLPHWPSAVLPDALYLAVRVTPQRIDLVDEELGWGLQATLEW